MNQLTIFKDVKIPVFPFPKTIMNYIFNAAEPQHYKKLNKTCKFIFAKYQRNCIEWLHLQEAYSSSPAKPIFQNKYHFITKYERDFDLLSSNLWLVSYLELNRASVNLYKTLMPKITKCSLVNLTLLRCADFLFEEFKFLTASGNIDTLSLHDTRIIYSNGEVVEFENLLPYFVNAQFITVNPVHTTKDTMQNLLNIQSAKRNRITMFRLSRIDSFLDPDEFFTLLTKICCMKLIKCDGRCIVKFYDSEVTEAFNAVLSKKLKEYKEPVKEMVVDETEEQS